MRKRIPYHLLSNIELIVDSSGAVVNTDNDYATVNGSGVITAVKSVSPGTTGRNFTVNGSGVTLAADGSFAFNGSGTLRSSSANTTWNFMHYNATLTNIKYTIWMVLKVGATLSPAGVSYGFIGNNGNSLTNKGMVIRYNNNTLTNSITGAITRGTASEYIAGTNSNNICPSNQYFVFMCQVDLAETPPLYMRYWINHQAIINQTSLASDITPVTTPTYALELGGNGNAVTPLVGNIKHVIICSGAVSQTNMFAISRALANYHNISMCDTEYVRKDIVYSLYDKWAQGKYHLLSAYSQNPVDPYKVVSVYSDGNAHVFDANKKIVCRKSANKAKAYDGSIGAESTIDDPGSGFGVMGGGGGYDNNGRFWAFYDTHTDLTVSGSHKAWVAYSDDNGTSWTLVELTSSLPADGMWSLRFYGPLIHNNGAIMQTFYTGNGGSQQGNYVFRSTDNGTTWTPITVKVANTTLHNESSIVALSSTDVLLVARDETTNEWHQYMSTDNGLTWTSQGALTFGLSIVSANPICLKSFTHKGVLCIVAYVPDRNNDILYAYYARASSLIASGLTGWDLDTKYTIWKSQQTDYHYHYGDVIHVDGKFNALGMYFYDPFPSVGTGTVNEVHYFSVPSYHLSKIETELGL